jgi:DNA-binding Lrp family transcriptional regulator
MRGIILRDGAVFRLKLKKSRKPWDRLDLRYVIVLYNERYTVSGIAERLGRTEKEVYAKIRQLRNKKIIKTLEKRICNDDCFECKYDDCMISASEAMRRENKNYRRGKGRNRND